MIKVKCLIVVVSFIFIVSCDVLKQASELQAFVKCKFKLSTVENITLAGVDVQKIKDYSQLQLMDVAKLTSAMTQNEFLLNFILNLQVLNPNGKTAALNQLKWILLIDGIEITNGELNQRYEIYSGSQSILPISLSINLKEVLKGETAKSLINFGLNLVDSSNKPTRITLKVKPTIIIAGTPVIYNEYIEVNNEF